MSDDFEEKAAEVPAAKVPRKRPAARKATKAKPKPAAETHEAAVVASAPAAPREERQAEPVAETRQSEPQEPRETREPRESRESREAREPREFRERRDTRESDGRESDGRDAAPEAIPFFVENSSSEPPGNSKKRRRRKKKQGQPQAQAQHPQVQHPQAVAPAAEVSRPMTEVASPAPVMHAAPRPKVDSDELSKKAWKIFLSEVGEEGLALIDDHDAREISRRCFRLAEIFLEEGARRSR